MATRPLRMGRGYFLEFSQQKGTSMYRTHHLGELCKQHQGQEVTLAGWINAIRDQGAGIHFIDLRDRYGITQIMIDGAEDPEKEVFIKKVRPEFVLQVKGVVVARPEGLQNAHLTTGEIEVKAKELAVLSPADTPPFEVSQKRDRKTGEILLDETIPIELRMKYRYLDFRRIPILERLKIRHKLIASIHHFLDREGFLNVETPVLLRATPEGARDFLVPSRKYPGELYALPQSPQLMKQILMVGGIDKYYQVVKCFRDEDSRKDRQPEFTQLDMEMSYVSEENDVMSLIERLVQYFMKEVSGVEVSVPFPRLPYENAMDWYASDKPDLRYELRVSNFTALLAKHPVFETHLQEGGEARGFCLKNASAQFSNKDLKDLGALQGVERPVYFVKVVEGGKLQGGFAGKTSEEATSALLKQCEAKEGDLIVVVTGKGTSFFVALDKLRRHFGAKLNLYNPKEFHFSWVVDFPLVEWNEEKNRFDAVHHPFTAPRDPHAIETNNRDLLSKAKAKAYDLVLNGMEAGGGSIRIHSPQVQQQMFNLLNIPEVEAKARFGFFLEALRYGTPPHGGIALGIDRLVAILVGTENIIESIPFPKSFTARCYLTEAPTAVEQEQLDELGMMFKEKKSDKASS